MCVCKGVVCFVSLVPSEASAAAIVRTHRLVAFLFFHPIQHPQTRLCLYGRSHGRSGWFHIPSFPVTDCRGTSGCHASLMLMSWDSSILTGRGLVDQAQSASTTPSSMYTHTSKQTHRLTEESKLHSNSLLAPPCKFNVYACVTVSLQYKHESHQKA